MTNSNDPLSPNDPYNRHGSRHVKADKSGSGGKVAGIAISAVAIAVLAAGALYFVDLDQTQEARLPSVDLSVTDGQMPAYDVDVAEVKLGSKDVEVDVPTIGVETETKTIEVEVPVDVEAGKTEKTIEVPTLSIERPAEDNPADNPVK